MEPSGRNLTFFELPAYFACMNIDCLDFGIDKEVDVHGLR